MESRGRRVHSIEKAIRLLDCFWEADSPLSLHELEQRTGWAKSTIHGLLATMLDSAVVEQNPTDGKYRLGYHLFELGSAVRQGWSVPELCRPHLRAMAARLGESVHLARLSGDEFLLLFYGYPGREQLREKLEALTRAMQQAVVVLPSGSDLHISISGGVAWYPEDGRDIETLKKYADFAMYQVKHSTKGQMKDFDIGVYNQEAYIARTRREFHQLISEERMYYYFQPIFSAQTGRVHAYEALMRSDLPTLRSPATIMKLAREQGALYEIERLTFRKALEGFDNLRSKNLVDRQALIFINSIASVCLRREDSEYMDQRWHELRRQMVIEITEEEEMNREALEIKRHAPGFSGMFALDDYGSGYSNEGSLLELAPRFIKVDISIIRGIDSDPDKQQILRNVVRYAQPRSMQIIAEGVETAAEMRTVIDLGADLLQGYFLARPAAVPDPIAPEAAEIIRAI